MFRSIRYAFAVFKEAMRRFADDDHAVYAGHMAFTLLLSFGPFIVCAIMLAAQIDPLASTHLKAMIVSLNDSALVPDPMANLLVSVVDGVAPDPIAAARGAMSEALADGALAPAPLAGFATAAGKIFESQLSTTGGGDILVIAITAIIGLYAGSSAFEAARNGFNEAYDTRDKRNVVFRRAQTYLLSLAIATLFIVASGLFVLLTVNFDIFALVRDAAAAIGMPDGVIGAVLLVCIALFIGGMFCMLLLGVHITLPRGYVKGWRLYVWAQDEIDDIRAARIPLLPGVIWSAVMWVAFAIVYSIALRTVVDFGANHGALAGVVATLMFFYVSATMIFIGAQINIAVATIDKNGEPKWPHPVVERTADFDETKEIAFQVLMADAPRSAIGRFFHALRGGGARRRPDHHVEVIRKRRELREARLAERAERKAEKRRLRDERRGRRSGDAAAQPGE